MNAEQIEAFIFVALTGSFSKTADLLYLSQPTVSMRIKALENTLGCKLFQRSGNSVFLTREGDVFLPYAKSVLQSLQDGQMAIQRSYGRLEGELVVSAVFVAAFYILPELVDKFTQLYPKIKLTIFTGHSHQVLEMVLRHEVSFGIARAVNHSQIKRVQLMPDEMVLAVHPDHPFQNKTQVTLEDVSREKLILFNRGSLDWTLINGAFSHYQLENNVVMEADNIEVVKRMVKQKLGIAFLPRFSIQEDVAAADLKEVEVLSLPHINRNFELIYHKDATINGITKTFIDFLIANRVKV
ncbi:LysR family transcriptional regulator [Brevibacillus borstelensis]|uniref:LysR family transcriptional regulator n=1 Tax=Brevibacillus borstelensis TaxID=45462 RepID=UPI0030C25BAB